MCIDLQINFYFFNYILKLISYLFCHLGLKILIVCFEKLLSNDWHRIACCIRELGNRMQGKII